LASRRAEPGSGRKRLFPGRGVALVALGLALLAVLASAGPAARPRPPAPPSGAALAALAQPPVRTSIASQRIYFVMPDRYANGDQSNDRGGLSGSRDVTGFDPTDPGWYHGGDLALTGNCTDTRHGLARLKDLGFTAIWVTPPFRQKTVQGSSAAYHGYWIEDFTTVDPHLGTDQQFGAFVDCAHRLGMKVYLDVVVNHTADVIQLRGGSSFVDPAVKPYRNCHGRKFDPAKFVTKTFPCLSAARMPRVPFVPPDERNAKKPAWLNDVTKYHDRGDVDFSSCSDTCFEQGDVFGLDDLFTEQPAVVNGLAAVYADWIRRYKIDGFRVDTARHVNRAFFKLWVPKILAAARAAGVPDFEIFGEVPLTDDADLSGFVRDRGLPNVLDFPFQDAGAGLAAGDTGAQALAARLNDDDYFRPSPGVAPTPPTFLGNHDMGRAAFQIQQRSQAEGAELLQRVLLGYDLLYLLRGAPVVYYGDEVGMIGRGGDQQARQDMFPTQVDEWKTQERVGSPPIGGGSSFDVVDNPIEVRLRELAALRDANPALATGATIVRQAQGSILVVSRIDAAGRREYVAAFNSGAAAAHVSIPTATPSSSWTPLLGTTQHPTSVADGALAIDMPAIGAVLLRADAELPVSAPARPALKVARDAVTPLWRLTATVPGGSPVSVGFAVHGKKGGWQRLGVDDSPPYRAFLDPRRYPKKGRVGIVAIVRSLDGQTAVSRVSTLVPRR
jgi:glycosidase